MAILFRRRRRKIAEEVLARLDANQVLAFDEGANCFGVESKGKGQVRGNGCLALSPKGLLFIMWVPRKELHVPLDRITSVERVKSHLGKSIFRELLKVNFVNAEGQQDSAAWYVRDLSAWETALRT